MADDGSLLDQIVQVAAYGTDPDLGRTRSSYAFSWRTRRPAAGTPQTLARQPSGQTAYLDQWWNELSTLAGDDPTRDEPAQDFFGTLAAALGPIGSNDLKQVNPSLHATGGWHRDPLQPVLAKARRMIFGNEEDGYALISQRLRDYMQTKIDVGGYEDRILQYCAHWQENKNLRPGDYAQHLLKADQKEALYRLVSKAWIEARSRESTYHAPAGTPGSSSRQLAPTSRLTYPGGTPQPYLCHTRVLYHQPSTGSVQLGGPVRAEKEGRGLALLLQDDQSRVEAQIAIGTGLLACGEGDIARAELRRAMLVVQPQHLKS